MVIVEFPAGVEVDVVTDIVDVPPLVTDAGVKDADAPAGRPDALNVTFWAEPAVVAVVTVYDVPEPGFTAWLDGEAEMEKSFGGGAAPQFANLKVAMRVLQLKVPLVGMYSVAYQKVQPSTGSTAIAL